jgi:hypothetical protein
LTFNLQFFLFKQELFFTTMMIGAIGFLLAIAGLSQAQLLPNNYGFNYPGLQYPVGFQPSFPQPGFPQPGFGVGQTAFSSRFGEPGAFDSGNSVGSYVFNSPQTGTVGGVYGTNQGVGFSNRFSDDDGGSVSRINTGGQPGVQSTSSFVSSTNNNGQTQQHSQTSITKDGQTTTFVSQG